MRKARRYEVEVEKERELARSRHLAELERQRADKRERCVHSLAFLAAAACLGATT